MPTTRIGHPLIVACHHEASGSTRDAQHEEWIARSPEFEVVVHQIRDGGLERDMLEPVPQEASMCEPETTWCAHSVWITPLLLTQIMVAAMQSCPVARIALTIEAVPKGNKVLEETCGHERLMPAHGAPTAT